MIEDYRARIAHLIPNLDRYVEHRIPTGGFLQACLENDLVDAAGRADDQNRYLLFEIACYMYNDMPLACRGSREKVAAWLAARPAVVVEKAEEDEKPS